MIVDAFDSGAGAVVMTPDAFWMGLYNKIDAVDRYPEI